MLKTKEYLGDYYRSEKNLKVHWGQKVNSDGRTKYCVECAICGYCELRRKDQLNRTDSWVCIGCSEAWITNAAKKLNFKYDGSTDWQKLPLTCVVCGNLKIAQKSHLNIGNVRCESCITLKYKSKLEQSGCQYVSRETAGKSETTYVEYLNPSGVTCKVQAGHLMSDNWLYSSAGTGRNIRGKTCVYKFSFICDGAGSIPAGYYYKIGATNNVKNRKKSLKIAFPIGVQILAEFSNYKEALLYERELQFENQAYKALPEIVAKFTSGRVYKNYPEGYTEWFFKKLEE